MIKPGYVNTMAQYNIWQNSQLQPILETMNDTDLNKDRGAFFGSIMGTLSHLLWGDQIWMSRFYGPVAEPETHLTKSATHVTTLAQWTAERFPLDDHIKTWAGGVTATDLTGDISWYSGAAGRDMSLPKTTCIVQLFNHQTHHRGQIHVMLTSAGLKAPVTDVPFMPEG